MNTDVFVQALQEATTRLAEVTSQFEELRKQQERIQALVAQLQAVIGHEEASPVSRPARPRVTVAIPADPAASSIEYVGRGEIRRGEGKTWRLAYEVLAKHGPLTVPKIYRRMFATTHHPPSKDSIRIAMLRKPETFINERGVFSLVPPSQREGLLEWEGATEPAP